MYTSSHSCNTHTFRTLLFVKQCFTVHHRKNMPMVGTYECLLLFSDCRWCGGSRRWWEHLNTTRCNQTCLNFLHSEVVGTQKPSFHLPLCPHTLRYPCDLPPSCPYTLSPLCPPALHPLCHLVKFSLPDILTISKVQHPRDILSVQNLNLSW